MMCIRSRRYVPGSHRVPVSLRRAMTAVLVASALVLQAGAQHAKQGAGRGGAAGAQPAPHTNPAAAAAYAGAKGADETADQALKKLEALQNKDICGQVAAYSELIDAAEKSVKSARIAWDAYYRELGNEYAALVKVANQALPGPPAKLPAESTVAPLLTALPAVLSPDVGAVTKGLGDAKSKSDTLTTSLSALEEIRKKAAAPADTENAKKLTEATKAYEEANLMVIKARYKSRITKCSADFGVKGGLN